MDGERAGDCATEANLDAASDGHRAQARGSFSPQRAAAHCAPIERAHENIIAFVSFVFFTVVVVSGGVVFVFRYGDG